MSNGENLVNLLEQLSNVSGLGFQLLTNHVDGNMTINKKGTIKLPVRLEMKQLMKEGDTSDIQDLRNIFPPNIWDLKLVPLVVFVDPVKFEKFMKTLNK